MKTISEQILEIKTGFYEAVELIEQWHNMGAKEPMASEMWKIYSTQSPEMKRINEAIQMLSEIESLIKENFVEKEFVEWLSTKCTTLPHEIGLWRIKYTAQTFTSKELYQHWLQNIKK